MYSEDQLLPISALQHLLFCERQCALIHVERQWAENRFTVEGQHLHRKAHHGRDEWRGSVRVVRSLWVRSFRLGLVGQADVVELEMGEGASVGVRGTVPFFFADSEKSGQSLADSEKSGQSPAFARVTPIEYKRGRPKKNDSDRVQLCAQALCLEEMLGVTIDAGELFYGKRQRRTHVEFDEQLRTATQSAALRLHQMIASGETPPAVREKKCDRCSLFHLCLPDVTQTSRSATRFVGRQFAGHLRDGFPTTDPFDAVTVSS
ncbi:MAG TPA: CRISPR-associated protein Cas4 [Lacipirellulaceae bacterium]